MNTEKYYLFNKDNQYYEFNSFNELVDKGLSRCGVSAVGNNFNDTYVNGVNYYAEGMVYTKTKVEYVVLDYLFRVVQNYELKKSVTAYYEEKEVLRYTRWKNDCNKNYPGFRNGPIPSTSSRRGYGKYFRHPKTRQEIIANLYDERFARGRRRKRQLPTSWDDIGRSDWNRKNWKSYRKTQYKPL